MKFIVKQAPDLAYVAHEVNLGRRTVWAYSFLGRDGNMHNTCVAESEAAAVAKARELAETHFDWPKGQKSIVWVRPPYCGRNTIVK